MWLGWFLLHCGCLFATGIEISEADNSMDFRPLSFLWDVYFKTSAYSLSLARRSPTEGDCV